MSELDIGERDVLRFLRPDTLLGALAYLVLFVLLAMLASRALRTAVHASMIRSGHIDFAGVHDAAGPGRIPPAARLPPFHDGHQYFSRGQRWTWMNFELTRTAFRTGWRIISRRWKATPFDPR